MKSLTSSCSKAIIHRNTDKGFSCFKNFSLGRVEVSSLPLKKLATIRFLHSLSEQHRRLQPVFSSSSSSSDSQADLETAETQPEEENPSKTSHVKFQLQKKCSFGEHFFMVGDHPLLGLWDPESAIPLTWSEGHVWTVELDIPVGISIQFKFILKTNTRRLLWQPDPDRKFKSWETENTIIVCEDWEEAEHQKVIEELPLADQDGQSDSNMAIVAENLTPLKEELVSDINLVSDTDSTASPVKEPSQTLSEELFSDNGVPSLEKPLAIVADNFSFPTEDFKADASNRVLGVKGTNYPNDESLAVSNRNVLGAENLGNISRVETHQNPATPNFEGNLVSDADDPVLVPGLTPLATVPTEEVMLDEDGKNCTSNASIGDNEATPLATVPTEEVMLDEDGKNSTSNASTGDNEATPLATVPTEEVVSDEDGKNSTFSASVGENEAKHHSLPELVEKQDNEVEPQEGKTTALPKDEEEQINNQHIQKPRLAREQQPSPEPFLNNVLQSNAQWGRKTLQKLLNGLRFL